jgi:two-component system, NtrC family, response regulator GlrR
MASDSSDSEPPVEETRLAPIQLSPVFRNAPRLDWTDAGGTHSKVVEGGRTTVGSAQGSGILIQDPTVSRVHAELEIRENGLWIRDLNSRNGTFVDGLQVTGARVPDKSRIRLGPSLELAVDYDPAHRRPVEIWPNDTFGRLVGTSVRMRELFARLSRLAAMDASVLIHGETGTGKELVAQAIHDASPRANKPFVVVDCAALPENLLDAELFGHSRGAFTGAVGARTGAIEAADGGTVFLDEVGELPIPMQPKLLRVLESRTVRRVGETGYRTVDVRFISATHRDLLSMVGAGEFREDLYFRLSVIPIEVPALRDRREDIEHLVNHFCKGFGFGGSPIASFDPQLMRELVDRPWRGNVRELRNFVDRARALGAKEALAMSQGTKPSAPGGGGGGPVSGHAAGPSGLVPPRPNMPPSSQNIPVAGAASPSSRATTAAAVDEEVFGGAYKDFRERWIDSGEKEYVRRLLIRHDRNVAAAAREAGVDRTYIYRLIRKHEL